MKTHKIIIALTEEIFLAFAKSLAVSDVKSSKDIIIGTIKRTESSDEESVKLIHGKNILSLIDYIKEDSLFIEKIILAQSAIILENSDLKEGDVIIPHTLLGKNGDNIFIETAIGENYDLKNFGLCLSGIMAEKSIDDSKNSSGTENLSPLNDPEDFLGDVSAEGVFTLIKALQSEKLGEEYIVTLQVGTDNYDSLIAISDIML